MVGFVIDAKPCTDGLNNLLISIFVQNLKQNRVIDNFGYFNAVKYDHFYLFLVCLCVIT